MGEDFGREQVSDYTIIKNSLISDKNTSNQGLYHLLGYSIDFDEIVEMLKKDK